MPSGVRQRRSFEASQVVVTVPLGVLKAGLIKFVPSLSKEKLESIKNLGFGNMEKLVLNYPPEQEGNVAWFEHIADRADQISSFFIEDKFLKNGVVAGLLTGETAVALRSAPLKKKHSRRPMPD